MTTAPQHEEDSCLLSTQPKFYLKAVLLSQNGAVDRSDDSAGVCTQVQTSKSTDGNRHRLSGPMVPVKPQEASVPFLAQIDWNNKSIATSSMYLHV